MTNDEIKSITDSIDADSHAIQEEHRLNAGFERMDPFVLAELTDKQLATFQARSERSSPQFIRAEQEWQRRLLVRQLRSGRFAVWAGLAGIVLGWLLSKL